MLFQLTPLPHETHQNINHHNRHKQAETLVRIASCQYFREARFRFSKAQTSDLFASGLGQMVQGHGRNRSWSKYT